MTKLKKLAVLTLVGLFLISFRVNAKSHSPGDTKFDYEKIVEHINEGIKNSMIGDSLLKTPVIVIQQPVDDNQSIVNEEIRAEKILQILGLIIPFVFALVVVFLCLWFKREHFKEKCKIIDKAIDNNYHLPEAFFVGRTIVDAPVVRSDSNGKPRFYIPSGRKLQGALLWIAFGLTGFLFFMVTKSGEIAVLCLLPVFIGLAKIIAVMMIKNSDRDKN